MRSAGPREPRPVRECALTFRALSLPPAPTARRRDVEKLGDALLPPAFLVRFVGQLKVVRCLKIPRSRAMGVMRHAFEEFNTLGAILPQVFEQEASAEWKARSEDELCSRGEAQ